MTIEETQSTTLESSTNIEETITNEGTQITQSSPGESSSESLFSNTE